MPHAARCKCRTQKSRQKSKSRHHRTTLSGHIFATKACIDNRKKNLLSSNICSRCPHNMVNFGLLAAEIVSSVWGTPGNFNGFRALAALLHWTEGTTYIRQGGHHVGHWPTFLVVLVFVSVLKVLTLIYDFCIIHRLQRKSNTLLLNRPSQRLSVDRPWSELFAYCTLNIDYLTLHYWFNFFMCNVME